MHAESQLYHAPSRFGKKNSFFRSFFLLSSLLLCLDPSCLVLLLIDKHSCWTFHYWLDSTEKMECTVIQWKQHDQPSVTIASRAWQLTTVSTVSHLGIWVQFCFNLRFTALSSLVSESSTSYLVGRAICLCSMYTLHA